MYLNNLFISKILDYIDSYDLHYQIDNHCTRSARQTLFHPPVQVQPCKPLYLIKLLIILIKSGQACVIIHPLNIDTIIIIVKKEGRDQ